ncbi:MAG: hypothetical protein ACT4N4_15105, partial [Rhodospirillales bacterium]
AGASSEPWASLQSAYLRKAFLRRLQRQRVFRPGLGGKAHKIKMDINVMMTSIQLSGRLCYIFSIPNRRPRTPRDGVLGWAERETWF